MQDFFGGFGGISSLHVGAFSSEADDLDNACRGTFIRVLKRVPHLRWLGECLYSLVFNELDIVTEAWSCLFC